MSDLEIIHRTLKKTARCRRLDALWRGLWLGLFMGGLVWLAVFGLYKVLPIPEWMVLAGAVAAGATVLITTIVRGAGRISLFDTARWVDVQQQLQERLSTALEVSGSDRSGEWQQLVVSDAARCATNLDTRRLVPWRFPKVGRWALLVLVLGVGLGFVPEYRSQNYIQQANDKANIRDAGKNLAELMRRSLDERPPALAPTEKAMEAVAELGDRLAQAPLTRTEALRDLASLTDKLSQQVRELAESPALKPLHKAAREPGGKGQTASAMRNQMDALQKSLGKAAGQDDKLNQLQKKLQQLKQTAAAMPDKSTPAGTQAREDLAKALSEAAQQANDLGTALPGLEEAIAALQSDQTDMFVKDLNNAVDDLEKMKAMAQAMQQLEQQMAKLGKDLAEQLEKGQAQAAQETLQKMTQQLQAVNLSPEQLEKLMKEVNQAVNPAGEYGKVAQHLKDAAHQMQQGEKTQAAQSLSAAAKELEQLMQQAADAKGLEEALDALARAQNAIASGKTWTQAQGGACAACQGAGCEHCRGGKPSWSQGGKPGSGVGTWAEETGWTYFDEQHERVDNSGVVRPDMDPHGIKDRGAGELNPNLLPDKVRGQISPGSSMPSITLKGVSIKGQSSVATQEAVTAAQNEAKSALNADQVPRPYRNTVRDYFDDLDK